MLARHKVLCDIIEYPFRKYSLFTSGGGIVFSRDVLADMGKIYVSSNYLKLHDVFIGMLSLRLGVDSHHDDWFKLFKGASHC